MTSLTTLRPEAPILSVSPETSRRGAALLFNALS